jgi:hypothetical protein
MKVWGPMLPVARTVTLRICIANVTQSQPYFSTQLTLRKRSPELYPCTLILLCVSVFSPVYGILEVNYCGTSCWAEFHVFVAKPSCRTSSSEFTPGLLVAAVILLAVPNRYVSSLSQDGSWCMTQCASAVTADLQMRRMWMHFVIGWLLRGT